MPEPRLQARNVNSVIPVPRGSIAGLFVIDAVCGPELPTVADEMRERSWAGRFDRAAGADPAAATFAETVGGRSRAVVPRRSKQLSRSQSPLFDRTPIRIAQGASLAPMIRG